MTFANNSLDPNFANRAYTYKVTSAPATTPISVDEVKSFAKISTTADDTLIAILINSVVTYAEQITRRDFITRTYRTFRDRFPGSFKGYDQFLSEVTPDSGNYGFELRRSPLQEIVQVSYMDTVGSTIVVPSTDYYNTEEDDFSVLLTRPSKSWPTDAADQLQAIQIDFKAGFGDNPADVPAALRNALLMHVTFLYENRGDCSDICGGAACGPSSTPSASHSIYLQHRIENL